MAPLLDNSERIIYYIFCVNVQQDRRGILIMPSVKGYICQGNTSISLPGTDVSNFHQVLLFLELGFGLRPNHACCSSWPWPRANYCCGREPRIFFLLLFNDKSFIRSNKNHNNWKVQLGCANMAQCFTLNLSSSLTWVLNPRQAYFVLYSVFFSPLKPGFTGAALGFLKAGFTGSPYNRPLMWKSII